jgi:hypothetical protein
VNSLKDLVGLLAAIIGLLNGLIALIGALSERKRAASEHVQVPEQIPSRSRWRRNMLNFVSGFGGAWLASHLLFEVSQGSSLPHHQIQGLRSMVHSMAPLITLSISGLFAAIILHRSRKSRPLSSLLIGFCSALVVLAAIAYVFSLRHL